jgi:hypothetical protein
MFGLRAQVRGAAPVTMALPQDSYLVRAAASWINGKRFGRIAVADPGSLTIDVVVNQKPDRRVAVFHVHDGDRLGDGAWRWFRWPWESQRPKVGDRLRITLARPRRLTVPLVRKEATSGLTERLAIFETLRLLKFQLGTKYYATEAAKMIRWARKRPPPRVYPRGGVLRGRPLV